MDGLGESEAHISRSTLWWPSERGLSLQSCVESLPTQSTANPLFIANGFVSDIWVIIVKNKSKELLSMMWWAIDSVNSEREYY